ncbi:MAG TPA: hypothetical protein VEW04_04155 [Allosphingosinicella sp.]|nr:hypothetical protein [Allosphingosinicella sp.]
MRIRAAFLAAGLLASPLQAQPQDEARAVIAALLAHEAAARGPESGAQTCVAVPLVGLPPAPGAEDEMAPDRAVRIRFQWHEPAPPAIVRPAVPRPEPGERRQRRRERPEPIPLPAALAPELSSQLDARRTEAESAVAVSLRQVDAALVPPPLRLQRPDDDCAQLSLSIPAIAGDTAFVAVNFACGPVCGNGGIYALQRGEGGWRVVGVGDTWIR